MMIVMLVLEVMWVGDEGCEEYYAQIGKILHFCRNYMCFLEDLNMWTVYNCTKGRCIKAVQA